MDHVKLNIEGHVLIKDFDTGEEILNRRNAIHYENMSLALASVLANAADVNGNAGFIQSLAFGKGGVIVDSSGNVVYNKTKTSDITDELYNETYSKNVDNSKDDDVENNTTVIHTGGATFSDIVVTCTLDYGDAAGQDAYDDTDEQEADFVFDEIGLISQQGRLLTHLIFHPVQKSSNRKIQIVYTVRISAG